jgi:hypothetical protein
LNPYTTERFQQKILNAGSVDAGRPLNTLAGIETPGRRANLKNRCIALPAVEIPAGVARPAA